MVTDVLLRAIRGIVIGTAPLEHYLRESRKVGAFTVAALLDEQDRTEFESHDSASYDAMKAGLAPQALHRAAGHLGFLT